MILVIDNYDSFTYNLVQYLGEMGEELQVYRNDQLSADQALGQVFGGNVIRAGRVMHGKTSLIHHDGRTLFAGLPNPFEAVRYHSLLVERESLPECLEISAQTDEGEIMGLRHREYLVEGVQFHPESILTQCGKDLLRNFLALGR